MPCDEYDYGALAELSSAELNIVLTAEAVPSAEYLQSVTGTPYVYLPPYGYSQTKEFLNSVAAVIGSRLRKLCCSVWRKKTQTENAFKVSAAEQNSRYGIFKG